MIHARGIRRPDAPVTELHILERGILMRAARVLRPYSVVGEEMMISKTRAKLGVICLTHVMTLAIGRDDYSLVLSAHPAMAATVRRNVLKDVVKQGVRANGRRASGTRLFKPTCYRRELAQRASTDARSRPGVLEHNDATELAGHGIYESCALGRREAGEGRRLAARV